MPNYQQMYITLFKRVTAVIQELQEAQQQTEEMYISSESTNIRVIDTNSIKDEISKKGEKSGQDFTSVI